MKNTRLILLSLSILLLFVLSALKPPVAAIKGSVNPLDAGISAWAVSNADTIKSAINNGVFAITDVRQGNYNIFIQAKAPYKNAIKEGVIVTEDGITEVGEIKLTQ